ncbi:TonB-dependent receptor plug domain-containing protein [Schleiferia thermophila]|uniref:Iron complex outermembrane receptor protein n=1 Tax=Schleiferia thermophila TaxID=884107 RepID=A0A369A3W8_9FLAO|nr:TonB-dependent receptor [Schleiferia thermophila]RCX03929.1 iron complex outermembrane receptor protein [Schleiferia thermophila]GCD80162.1 TonB-dependent receptor [Schleiferia thermophila]
MCRKCSIIVKTVFPFVFIITPLFAQKDTSVVLKEVSVIGSRTEIPLKETPRNIWVITSDEIRQSASRSVNELLQYSALLDVRSRGPLDAQTDLSIRGGTFDQALVMVNGIKMLDPQTGHHQMNLFLHPTNIERIEILPGGASRLYGQGAFSGAINIVTKPASNRIFADLSVGDFGLVNAAAGWSRSYKKGFFVQLFGHLGSHSGYMENTDLNSYAATLSLGRKRSRSSWEWQTSFHNKRFGAQNFYSFRFPFQQEEIRLFTSSFQYRKKSDLWTHTFVGFYREHQDRFELFREGPGWFRRTNGLFIRNGDTARFSPTLFYTGHNFHRTHVASAEWTSTLDMGFFGFLNLGTELRSEWIYSNRLGSPLSKPVQVSGYPDAFYNRYAQRLNIAFTIDHALPINDKWSVNYGLWVNQNSDFGRRTFFGAELQYKYNQQTSMWAGYNKAFRIPTYTDLYYNVGGAVGSIDLQPELADNYEIGVRKTFHKSVFNGSVYLRDAKSLIDWIVRENSNLVEAANLTAVLYWGADAQYKQLFDANPLKISWIQLSTGYNDFRRQFSGFQSVYALDILQWKGAFVMHHALTKALDFNYSFVYLKRSGTYTDAFDQIQAYPDVLLVNLKTQYRIKENYAVYAEITNLLNQMHMDRGGILLPGRWLRAGATLQL